MFVIYFFSHSNFGFMFHLNFFSDGRGGTCIEKYVSVFFSFTWRFSLSLSWKAASTLPRVLSTAHPIWRSPLSIPGGNRQSPIDIAVQKSVYDPRLPRLYVNYNPQACRKIYNNGYSFLVEYDDTTDTSSKTFC